MAEKPKKKPDKRTAIEQEVARENLRRLQAEPGEYGRPGQIPAATEIAMLESKAPPSARLDRAGLRQKAATRVVEGRQQDATDALARGNKMAADQQAADNAYDLARMTLMSRGIDRQPTEWEIQQAILRSKPPAPAVRPAYEAPQRPEDIPGTPQHEALQWLDGRRLDPNDNAEAMRRYLARARNESALAKFGRTV